MKKAKDLCLGRKSVVEDDREKKGHYGNFVIFSLSHEGVLPKEMKKGELPLICLDASAFRGSAFGDV